MMTKEGWWFLIGVGGLGVVGYAYVAIRELIKII